MSHRQAGCGTHTASTVAPDEGEAGIRVSWRRMYPDSAMQHPGVLVPRVRQPDQNERASLLPHHGIPVSNAMKADERQNPIDISLRSP